MLRKRVTVGIASRHRGLFFLLGLNVCMIHARSTRPAAWRARVEEGQDEEEEAGEDEEDEGKAMERSRVFHGKGGGEEYGT